jgi:pimeloyl-ACP methyl ester carboxylesterase
MLHAEVFGPEDGPTIVLAHGWTETHTLWSYQIRELSKDVRVVAYDLRGHGGSEPAAGRDYSFDRFGEDVESILVACVPEGERAVVVGHSLGAMSIAAWAEHHDVERRIRAAALLNTGIGNLLPEQLLVPVPKVFRPISVPIGRRAFLGNRAPLPPFDSPIQYAMVRYIAFGDGGSPAKVAFFERMFAATRPSARARSGIAMADIDLMDALPRLTVPTLVMCGQQDRLTPPTHARRIADRLPNLVELIELPATGHMGPLERPDEVSHALRKLVMSSAAEPLRAQAA